MGVGVGEAAHPSSQAPQHVRIRLCAARRRSSLASDTASADIAALPPRPCPKSCGHSQRARRRHVDSAASGSSSSALDKSPPAAATTTTFAATSADVATA